MEVTQAYATLRILLTCDLLDRDGIPVSVESVWWRLAQRDGYEYPKDVLAQVIQERDQYIWDSQRQEYVRKGREEVVE